MSFNLNSAFFSIFYYILIWNFTIKSSNCEGLAKSEYLRYDSDLQPRFHYNNSSLLQTKAGHNGVVNWLQNAQDMFASPAGHVMMQVAKELLNRSTGNSQVVSSVH